MAGRRGPSVLGWIGRGILLAIFLIVSAFTAVVYLPTHFPPRASPDAPNPKVKQYYLALGDSLAFGFQPDLNWAQGYPMEWWADLQRHGSRGFYDLGCSGETSAQFISGGCPFDRVKHNFYAGSQLDAALTIIHDHPGQVGPISLDIGADDFQGDVNTNGCKLNVADFNKRLAALDQRLAGVILPKLVAAITDSKGQRTTDLVLMNYYDPYENLCPNVHPYFVQIDNHLARDAAALHVPVANVAAAFDTSQHPNPDICKLTWMCSAIRSVHPNTTGYGVIAHVFEQTVGY